MDEGGGEIKVNEVAGMVTGYRSMWNQENQTTEGDWGYGEIGKAEGTISLKGGPWLLTEGVIEGTVANIKGHILLETVFCLSFF